MINPISSVINPTPPEAKRRRVDRFDFPIARPSFETASFEPSHAPATSYEKTLQANLFSASMTPIIPPQEAPPPIPSWPIRKPLYAYKVAEVQDDFYLNPLAVFQKTLFLAAEQNLLTYSSKTLQPQGGFKLPSDSDQAFVSIEPNPSFPLISSRTAPLEGGSVLGSILTIDIETKKLVNDLDLADIASDDDVGRGCSISWRNAWEFVTPIGYRCLQIDRRDEKTKKISLGDSPSDGTLSGVAWHQDGQLLATGFSEGAVRIYDIRSLKKDLFHYTHGTSSVKALAWHSSLPLLASGGGTSDRVLKVIDLRDQTLVSSQDTKAQIASLIWLSKEHILTGYGYGSSVSNLEVHHLQSRSIIPLAHPSHPSILRRRVWTIKDPSTETGLSYYTLNGSKNENEENYLSKWFLKKEDPLKRKALEASIR